VADREQVDQRERAAGAARRRAQDADEHDAPQVACERQREPSTVLLCCDEQARGDNQRVDTHRGDCLRCTHVGNQQCRRAQQATDDVQAGLGVDRGAHFAFVQGGLALGLGAWRGREIRFGVSHPRLPKQARSARTLSPVRANPLFAYVHRRRMATRAWRMHGWLRLAGCVVQA
jgi:hypothetical protein